jgi:hypothetical protein
MSSCSSLDEGGNVRLHVLYDGKRAEGIYHPRTGLLDIVSGPAPKRAFDPRLWAYLAVWLTGWPLPCRG